MALVRRPAATALAVVLLASGLVGCAGTGSDQARDENRKMDCLTRCGKGWSNRPILVARRRAWSSCRRSVSARHPMRPPWRAAVPARARA